MYGAQFEVLYRLFVGVNTENGYCDDIYQVVTRSLAMYQCLVLSPAFPFSVNGSGFNLALR